ncbi:isochorismatase family protein [Candidatus Micrarchaeota archaeon]|nr:isochorismatase family protein [Candidatus Micrarchaeota archaeon]
MEKTNYLRGGLEKKCEEWLGKIRKHSRLRLPPRVTKRSCALLVIDMQNFFLNEKSHAFVPAGKAIIQNIKKLIKMFRSLGLPIIFTRYALAEGEDTGMMEKWWADAVLEGTFYSKLALKRSRDDKVIRKSSYSAFYGTNLERILRENNIEKIVLTGVMTHLCCDTTAREAFLRGFNVYFVMDATATYNEELHLASILALSHGFVYPVTTNQTIALFE